MSLDAYALTTIQTARAYVLRSATDDSMDTLLELLVNAYSRAVQAYCEREWRPKSDAVARKFRYDGCGVLGLGRFELRSVTSVTLHTDLPASSQRVLAAGDSATEGEYRLEPRAATDVGTYLWLALPVLEIAPGRLHMGAEVSILGNWGAGTVPADVELATLLAVADGYRNPEGFASRGLGELTFTEVPEDAQEAGRSLPPDARALLAPHRRVALG